MQDLRKLVKSAGPLDVRRAVNYIVGVAQQLEGLHSAGGIHRNVRPEEILIHEDDRVLLVVRRFNYSDVTFDLSEAASAADYLAPEQALNSHIADGRADIYSLGCTFYFCLVGRPPFADGSISERLLKHQVGDVPKIVKVRPDVSIQLSELCERMMAKSPAQRPQTAAEVSVTLRKWLSAG
jgi:eukaryotic-like serine/threonine-protein kinase